MFETFTPADLVSILNAINVPVCFSVAVGGLVIIAIKRALQRSDDTTQRQMHNEKMEQLRLSNTKEITNKFPPISSHRSGSGDD